MAEWQPDAEDLLVAELLILFANTGSTIQILLSRHPYITTFVREKQLFAKLRVNHTKFVLIRPEFVDDFVYSMRKRVPMQVKICTSILENS